MAVWEDRPMSDRPLDRVLTSLGTAAFALAATVAAHVGGGGQLPGGFVLTVAALPTFLATLAFGWLQIATPRIIAAVAVSQIVFHYAFAATSGASVERHVASLSGGVHHHSPASVVTTGGVAEKLHMTSVMALSHVAAAVVIAALMLSASRLTSALRAFVARIRQRFVGLVSGPVTPTVRCLPCVPVRYLESTSLSHRVAIRGPPLPHSFAM